MRKLFIALLLTCTACGGSGGGDDDGEDLRGIWLTSMRLLENSCGLDLSSIGLGTTVSPTYQVDQNGNAIVAKNLASGATFSGATINDGNGFTTTATETLSAACRSTSVLQFQNVDGDEADGVSFSLQVQCNDGSSCAVTYSGTADRQ